MYNKGEFQESLKNYEKALDAAPDSDIVNFDFGAGLYKMKSFDNAMEHFKRALVTDDPSLEQQANYNLGNAEYKFGIGKEDTNINEAVGLLEQALRHYERAVELDAEDEDAKYNYEFVKKELERLKKKQQQQQQKDQKEQEEQEKEEQEEQEQKDQEQEEQDKEEQEQKKQEQEKEEEQEKEQQEQPEEKQPQEEQQEEEQEKEQEQQEPEPKEEEQEPQPSQGEAQQQAPKEMSEQQAEMLLDNYQQDEEPRGLYKEKIEVGGMPDVLRDW